MVARNISPRRRAKMEKQLRDQNSSTGPGKNSQRKKSLAVPAVWIYSRCNGRLFSECSTPGGRRLSTIELNKDGGGSDRDPFSTLLLLCPDASRPLSRAEDRRGVRRCLRGAVAGKQRFEFFGRFPFRHQVQFRAYGGRFWTVLVDEQNGQCCASRSISRVDRFVDG